MLFAHLQRHTERAPSRFVHRNAYYASWKFAFEFFPCSEVRCRRPAEPHRYAETLCGPYGYVGSPFPRRGEHCERQYVRRHGNFHAYPMCRLDEFAVVVHLTQCARVLEHGTEKCLIWQRFEFVAGYQFYAEGFGAGRQHFLCLREQVFRNEKFHRSVFLLFAGTCVEKHKHGFGRSSAFIQQRSVGDRQSGERRYHGLEVDKRFQPSLRYLGLVRCVRRVPRRVFEYVSLYYGRSWRRVVTKAYVTFERFVERGQFVEVTGVLSLGHALRKRQRVFRAYVSGYCLVYQFVERCGPDGR